MVNCGKEGDFMEAGVKNNEKSTDSLEKKYKNEIRREAFYEDSALAKGLLSQKRRSCTLDALIFLSEQAQKDPNFTKTNSKAIEATFHLLRCNPKFIENSQTEDLKPRDKDYIFYGDFLQTKGNQNATISCYSMIQRLICGKVSRGPSDGDLHNKFRDKYKVEETARKSDDIDAAIANFQKNINDLYDEFQNQLRILGVTVQASPTLRHLDSFILNDSWVYVFLPAMLASIAYCMAVCGKNTSKANLLKINNGNHGQLYDLTVNQLRAIRQLNNQLLEDIQACMLDNFKTIYSPAGYPKKKKMKKVRFINWHFSYYQMLNFYDDEDSDDVTDQKSNKSPTYAIGNLNNFVIPIPKEKWLSKEMAASFEPLSLDMVVSCLYTGKPQWHHVKSCCDEHTEETLKSLRKYASPNFYFNPIDYISNPRLINLGEDDTAYHQTVQVLYERFTYQNMSNIFWELLSPVDTCKWNSGLAVLDQERQFLQEKLLKQLYEKYKLKDPNEHHSIVDAILKRERRKIRDNLSTVVALEFLKVICAHHHEINGDMKKISEKMAPLSTNNNHVNVIFASYPSSAPVWTGYFNIILKESLELLLNDMAYMYKTAYLLNNKFD